MNPYKEELKTFRSTYVAELYKCMDAAIEIRDDKKASDRDRNEAIKTISRLLSALQPDKTEAKADSSGEVAKIKPLGEEYKKKLRAILDEEDIH